jgi:hypothetical protein
MLLLNQTDYLNLLSCIGLFVKCKNEGPEAAKRNRPRAVLGPRQSRTRVDTQADSTPVPWSDALRTRTARGPVVVPRCTLGESLRPSVAQELRYLRRHHTLTSSTRGAVTAGRAAEGNEHYVQSSEFDEANELAYLMLFCSGSSMFAPAPHHCGLCAFASLR